MEATLLFLCGILISFIVGYFGRNRKMGFWGYFFATLFLTPFIGIILLIASEKVNGKDTERRSA